MSFALRVPQLGGDPGGERLHQVVTPLPAASRADLAAALADPVAPAL
jgi:hypothetical protein